MDVFMQGLCKEEIKDELAISLSLNSLKDLENLATRIYLCLTERRRETSHKEVQSTFLRGIGPRLLDGNNPSSPERSSDPEPMQLGRCQRQKVLKEDYSVFAFTAVTRVIGSLNVRRKVREDPC
ncbi:hypothetical protein XENORESO_008316 [Xenotaenia resolanae]|uniref:Uncharacterized protein n=1 Tax=Xenotaenia resolanae TaxID=208358 RepID=A0ABV0WP75_9TELE